MKKIIIAYIPGLHQGYVKFLQMYHDAELCVIDTKSLEILGVETPYFNRNVMAMEPELIVLAINGMGIIPAKLVNEDVIKMCLTDDIEVIMPTEDVTLKFGQRFLPGKKITFDSFFLRRDKFNALKENEISPDRTISEDRLDFELMFEADRQSKRSSDWWRQVGGLVAKDGSILLTGYNHHMPHEQTPYLLGDPRHNFNAGERIDLSTAIHAEVSVIATAAKRGISLEGCDLYVTTFPCPGCAKAIAEAGIKKVYYRDGYSLLDAEDIFKVAKIEVVLVK